MGKFRIEIEPSASIEIAKHKKAGNQSTIKKLAAILLELTETPFEGTGKPEPLKGNFSGYWSRRITDEHRLVYKVLENRIHIIQCRFHY